MKTLILVRGISGCGKTTLARQLAPLGRRIMLDADTFFLDEDGEYRFDPSKLPEAHAWCQAQAELAMKVGMHVIVHNTFTQRWEMEPYILMADEYEYRATVVSLYDGGRTDEELAARNSHGVPLDGISRMRERYEHDWKNGDTRPPWERGG